MFSVLLLLFAILQIVVTDQLNDNQYFTVGLTLGAPNNYYIDTANNINETIDIGETAFNTIFHDSIHHIIKRECCQCTDMYQIIYYKRITNLNTFDVYNSMIGWLSGNNLISNDFNLYSTLQDALNDTNPWLYCNYDDNNHGAFRDCGPTYADSESFQWTGNNNGKSSRFSIYTGCSMAVWRDCQYEGERWRLPTTGTYGYITDDFCQNCLSSWKIYSSRDEICCADFYIDAINNTPYYTQCTTNGSIAETQCATDINGLNDQISTIVIRTTTSNPSPSPTYNPTTSPTQNTTTSPTYNPTPSPTSNPTASPTNNPTTSPTNTPTASPTNNPIASSTSNPTTAPTHTPTTLPTDNPTASPTDTPTNSPINSPTNEPTLNPTNNYAAVIEAEWIRTPYIILCILMMMLIGILIILTTYKFNSKSDGIFIMKRIRIIAVSQMIGFFLSYLLWMICIIILGNNNDNHLTVSYIFFAILQYLFWMIGWILFYMLLIYKLYHTFNDSPYKMSKKFLYFHIFILCFIPIWYLIITISDELNLFNSTRNIYFILSVLGTILISFGILTLMISFNRNLFFVISLRKRSIFCSNTTTDIDIDDDNEYNRYDVSNYHRIESMSTDSDNVSLNNTQISMMNVLTKQTLLSSVMLFGGFLYVIIILFMISNKEKTSTEWLIYEWCLGCYVNINVLCIYFGWKVNIKQYRFFCGGCHSLLIKICESLVKKRMLRLQSDFKGLSPI